MRIRWGVGVSGRLVARRRYFKHMVQPGQFDHLAHRCFRISQTKCDGVLAAMLIRRFIERHQRAEASGVNPLSVG